MQFISDLAKAFSGGGVKIAPGEESKNDVSIVRENLMSTVPRWDKAQIMASYGANEWVQAAVSLLAAEMGRIKYKLVKQNVEGETTEVIYNHPLLELLEEPNTVLDGMGMLEFSQIHGELAGRYAWLVVEGPHAPSELWPLDPISLTAKNLKTGPIAYYNYRVNGVDIRLETDEVLDFRFPNPFSMYNSTAPTGSAENSIATDIFSGEWTKNFFHNFARPDWFLLFKKITEESRKRFEKKFSSKFRGVKNAGKMAVLRGEDATLHQLGTSQKDQEFSAQNDSRRDKILATSRVPRDLIGLGQSSNRASIEASIFIFMRFAMLHRMERNARVLDRCLRPKFETLKNQPGAKERIKLTFEDPVPQNTEELLKQAESIQQQNYGSINDSRKVLGLKPLDSPMADEVLIPFNKIPLSMLNSKPKAPEKSKKKKRKTKKQSPVKSKEIREVLKKQHLIKHEMFEERFIEVLRKLFNEQKKEVLKDLREKSAKKELDPMSPLNKDKWLERFIKLSTPLYETMTESGGNQAIALAGSAEELFMNTEVRSFISEMAFNFSTVVNETTIKQIRQQLDQGINAGEGIPKIAERIEEVFKEANEVRAVMIARTETTKSLNGGSILGFEQLGVQQKEWLATDDERTRPTHAAADGQVVDMESKFDVGGADLMHPGDPTGPADEVINCRCTMIPVLPE